MTALYSGLLVKKWQNQDGFMYLHSMFNHSFNLTDGEDLLHVGIFDNNIVPFGLFFSKEDFYILQSMICEETVEMVIKKSILNIGNIIIDLYGIKFYEPYPLHLKKLHEVFVSNIYHLSHLLNEKAGLDFTNEIIGRAPYLKYCYTKKQTEVTHYLMHYIGHGPGLTPSGDDFTVGILALNRVSPYLSSVFIDSLREYIKNDVTTDISKAYLNAALSGHFSMQVNRVIESLCQNDTICFQNSVNQLKKVGNTSGYDTLIGIFTGIQQVMQKQEKE